MGSKLRLVGNDKTAIIVELGVLGITVKRYANSVAEDRKVLFMRANREAKILVAVECLNRLGERLWQSTHGLLLSAGLPDFQYRHVVSQCVPEDVKVAVARITWQDNMAGENLNDFARKVQKQVDDLIEQIRSY